MGGGGGGYDRPGGGGSGNGKDELDEDELDYVPTPNQEPDDGLDDETPEESAPSSTEPKGQPDDASQSGGGAGAGAGVGSSGSGANGSPDSGEDEESDKQEPLEDDPEDNVEDDEEDDDEEEDCLIAEDTVLQSPNPEPLEDAVIDEIHTIEVRDGAVCVVDADSRTIGSVAEPWVDTLKQCLNKGYPYRARVLDIDGGKCEVRIVNECLVRQDTPLTAENTEIRGELYEGRVLDVRASDQGSIVVTDEGTRVGEVPEPWGILLSECIDRGTTYVAEVNEVSPDACIVTIQNGSIDE